MSEVISVECVEVVVSRRVTVMAGMERQCTPLAVRFVVAREALADE